MLSSDLGPILYFRKSQALCQHIHRIRIDRVLDCFHNSNQVWMTSAITHTQAIVCASLSAFTASAAELKDENDLVV